MNSILFVFTSEPVPPAAWNIIASEWESVVGAKSYAAVTGTKSAFSLFGDITS